MGTGHGHGGKNVVIWRIQFFLFLDRIYSYSYSGVKILFAQLCIKSVLLVEK